MRKNLLLLLLTLFSFSAIHAEIDWKLENGTLTISGTGNMPDFSINVNNRSTAPWDSQRDKIKTVVIKDGVTNIGDCAFYECTNLTSITIPNSVTSIGDRVFYYCIGLTSVTIPKTVTSIGEGAFLYCIKLTSVEIPNSVTSIGDYAFGKCYDLTSVTIPNSVTSIGDRAFYFCSSLTSVKIPSSITSIGDLAFCNCENLTSAIIPNSVTSIGYKAFDGCHSLTSVTIPNSVTSIGDLAFCNCENLTSAIIPNSVTSIGEYFFYGCIHLTSIEIPNSVTSIGYGAFYNCKALTSITFKRSTPPTFGEDVFKNVDKSILVYVPANSREEYKNALKDFGFSNIKAIPISLTGSESYTQDSQIDGVDVSYTRDFGWTWEAIYLPFSLKYEDWKDDFKVARINAVRQYDTDDDGKIDRTEFEFVKMKEGSVIYPNTPYLILAKTPGEKTIYVENTTVYEPDEKSVECSTTTEQFTFTGTYKRISFFDIIWNPPYVLDGSRLKKATSSIDPYRWYMKRENRDSAYGIKNNSAKEISIRVVGEETTGISQLQITNDELPVYDLNGRRVNENNLKPGMYVKNGRKFVVK